MSNLRYISLCGAVFAAVSLSAAYTFWHGRPTGPAALVVTPRQYVPLLPGATTNFTALLYDSNGGSSDVSSNGTTWSCAPAIGTANSRSICITGAAPAYGWVEATCSGLTKRVYVKVSADGSWNPDMDSDADGLSDAHECESNAAPDRVTLLNVSAKLTKVQ
jgi:hypothetical protein